MRNLDEYKAEIFRRSEKRLKEHRRRRNTVLGWCIPFFCCIAVLSASVFPSLLSVDNDSDPEAANDYTNDGNDGASIGSINYDYTMAEIFISESSPEEHRVITENNEVMRLFNVIQELYTDAFSDGSFLESTDFKENFGSLETHTYEETEKISIKFSTKNGNQTIYSLTEKTLKNETNGEKKVLSDEQLSDLKNNLGLSQ